MIPITNNLFISEEELEIHFVRSSGPGGQNVNKVATAAQLRFNVAESPSLPVAVKRRALKLAGRRATDAGEIIIDARRHRSQEQNRDDAIGRLIELLKHAAVPPKPRRKTRPTAASKRRRLESKKRRGETKKLRGPVRREDP